MTSWRLLLVVLHLCILSGCTTYYIHIRTFPPAAADVYIDGELHGVTSDSGKAHVSSDRRLQFVEPRIELRKDDQHGRLVMKTVKGVAGYVYLSVVFSLAEIPLELPRHYASGRNTFTLRNPNDVPVLVGIRKGSAGANILLFEGVAESVRLSDGHYEICLLYADKPHDLFVMRQGIHLGGRGGSLEVPLREERRVLAREIGGSRQPPLGPEATPCR